MPKYKFHIYNDDRTIDDQGRDCADLDAARTHATEGARSIMAEEIRVKGEISLHHWIEIEDERGDMHVVPFADTVKINH